MGVLTVATRGTDLAVAQTELIIAMLKEKRPDLDVRIKKIVTSGDKDKKTALWNLPGTGFFTSQVEDELLAGKADFAVHSLKDLPTAEPDRLCIAAVAVRGAVGDSVIAADSVSCIADLKRGCRVGTSSFRRGSQMLHLRDDVQITSVRGNVPTRVGLVKSGEIDAVIVAKAGLERLGLADEISFDFDIEDFLPAPGQGALAIQCRRDDESVAEILSLIDDKNSRCEVLAERQILVITKCGCHGPVGAFAKITGDQICIEAFISDTVGKRFIRKKKIGKLEKAIETAQQLACDLLTAGGSEILEELKNG